MDYEAIIIGGGTTGTLIALELGKLGHRVLVVEAGGRAGMQGPLNLAGDGGIEGRGDFQGSYRMRSDLGTQYHQGVRGLGGSGQIYAGWTYRFRPVDFRLRSTHGVGADWPIGYDDLAPFYQRAEELMGVAGEPDPGVPEFEGPFPMEPFPLDYPTQVFNRLLGDALPFVTAPQPRNRVPYGGRPACRGYRQCWDCPIEAKWTPQNSVIRETNKYGNIEYLIRSPVVFIEVGDGGRIDHVRCLTSNGESRLTAKTYVLACNGIETPRLMLHCSQPNAPEGLANSSGQVGRNYMGHPHCHWEIDLAENVYGGRGPLHTSNCTAFADHEDRAVASAVNLHYIQAPLPRPELNPDLWGAEMIRDAQKDSGSVVYIGLESEMLPDPSCYIELDANVDQYGMPVAIVHYVLTQYARNGINRAATLLREALLKKGLKDFEQRRPQHDGGHWMGATRMGSSPDDSVTDSFGRAWDHPNLFIAGASLYPTSTPFNPIETSVALALRSVPEIAASLGGSRR